MAKLRFWLIPVILGLVLHLAYSPGWAATTYGLSVKTPSIDVKRAQITSETIVNVPLVFFPTGAGLQHFTLRAVYDPNFLALSGITPEQSQDLLLTQYGDMVSACVGITDPLKVWTITGSEFPTLHFTLKPENITRDRSTEVSIDGFAGKNYEQELSVAKVKINFIEKLCTVNIKPNFKPDGLLPTGSNYTIRLWTADRRREYKKDNLTTLDPAQFQLNQNQNYWSTVESEGYRSELQKIEIGPNDESKPEYTIDLDRMLSRIAFIRKTTPEKKLEFRFAYRNYKGQITDWPEGSTDGVKLILTFSRPGDTTTEVSFDPKPDPDQSSGPSFIVSPQFVTDKSFGASQIKHIVMTIDPEAYYLRKDPQEDGFRYTVSFETKADKVDVDKFTSTFEVDAPASQVDVTKASIAEARDTFTGNEIKSVGEIAIQGKLYLTADDSEVISTTFSASQMSLNYLKDTTAEDFVDPETLAAQRFNLAVELKPVEDMPNITVVSINFTTEQGKSFEYQPDDEAKHSAGPIVFEIPLHKGVQKYFRDKYYNGSRPSNEDSLGADHEKITDDIYYNKLITEESQRLDSERYGIYFQNAGGILELFIPNTSSTGESIFYGEGIEVTYHDYILFAKVTTKHTSDWLTALAEDIKALIPASTVPGVVPPPKKKDGDHWYECFIKAIRPGFLHR